MPTETPCYFVRKTRPQTRKDADGGFVLVLPVKRRISAIAAEPYEAIWRGPEAQAFWAEHSERLTAGQPLALALDRLRSRYVGKGHYVDTWIEGEVLSCTLLPRAHEAHAPAAPTPEHANHA